MKILFFVLISISFSAWAEDSLIVDLVMQGCEVKAFSGTFLNPSGELYTVEDWNANYAQEDRIYHFCSQLIAQNKDFIEEAQINYEVIRKIKPIYHIDNFKAECAIIASKCPSNEQRSGELLSAENFDDDTQLASQ